jgi:hypothetical protein
MSDTTREDDDFLDGICDLDADMGPPTPDDEVVWVVLFASVLGKGRDAIEARAAEWRELFGGEGR